MSQVTGADSRGSARASLRASDEASSLPPMAINAALRHQQTTSDQDHKVGDIRRSEPPDRKTLKPRQRTQRRQQPPRPPPPRPAKRSTQANSKNKKLPPAASAGLRVSADAAKPTAEKALPSKNSPSKAVVSAP